MEEFENGWLVGNSSWPKNQFLIDESQSRQGRQVSKFYLTLLSQSCELDVLEMR